MRRVFRALALVPVLVLLAGPAVALHPSQVAPFAAPVALAPMFVPGPGCVGSSVCSPGAAPILKAIAEYGGQTAVKVPLSVAQRGGYYSTYGAGGLSGETAGGIAGLGLGLGSLFGWKLWNRQEVPLPEPPPPSNLPGWSINVGWSVDTGQSGSVSRQLTVLQGTSSNSYTLTQVVEYVPCIPASAGSTYCKTPTATTTPDSVGTQYRCYANQNWGQLAPNVSGVQALRFHPEVGYKITTTVTKDNCPEFEWKVNGELMSIGTQSGTAVPAVRHIQQTVTCRDANGVNSPFTSSGPGITGNGPWEIPALACPPGSTAVEVEADLKTEGADDLDLGKISVPEKYREMVEPCRGIWGTTPECQVIPRRKVDAPPTTDPSKDFDRHPERWECRYGGVTIPMEYCGWYRTPKLDPPEVPVPIEDPANPGEPIPDPEITPPTDPVPEPPGDPAPGSSPCPALSSISLGDVLTGKVVYLGVLCALHMAFVPSTSVMTASVDRVQARLEDTAPYVAINGGIARLQGVIAAVNGMGGGGCSGPTLQFSGVTIDPVNLCAAPLSTYAGWVKTATSLGIIAFALMRIVSTFASAFNIRMPWDHSSSQEQGTLW